MLRSPLVQPQTLTNNGNSYQQVPIFNERPNELSELSDIRTSTNGFIKKSSLFREPLTSLGNNHPTVIGSSQAVLQSRVSEPSLAASVALVQENSSQKQSAFDITHPSNETALPRHANGGIHTTDVSQLHIGHSECRSKYDRLLEAHRKLQRTNGALEGRDKLCYYCRTILIEYSFIYSIY